MPAMVKLIPKPKVDFVEKSERTEEDEEMDRDNTSDGNSSDSDWAPLSKLGKCDSASLSGFALITAAGSDKTLYVTHQLKSGIRST